MKVTTTELTFLEAKQRQFKDDQGRDVKFVSAKLFDEDGNNFQMTVSADAGDLTKMERSNGEATIEIYTGKTKTGQDVPKLRLAQFVPSK